MTRARERLLLSGVVDFARLAEEERRRRRRSAGSGPALARSCPSSRGGGGGGPRCQRTPAGAERALLAEQPGRLGTVLRRRAATPSAPRGARAGRRARGLAGRGRPQRPRPREDSAAPIALPRRSATPRSAMLERCGYRYYLERVLRMPEEAARRRRARRRSGSSARARNARPPPAGDASTSRVRAAPDGERRGALRPRELGIGSRRRGARGDRRADRRGAREPAGRAHRRAPRRRQRRASRSRSASGQRAARRPASSTCSARSRRGALLVVDYKSDRLEPEADLEALVARDYGVQRLLYALAVLRERRAASSRSRTGSSSDPRARARALHAGPSARRSKTSSPDASAATGRSPFAVSRAPAPRALPDLPGPRRLCSWSEEETLREDPGRAGGEIAL